MAKEIIAYSSRSEKASEDFEYWAGNHILRFLLVGVIISTPVALYGAVTSPKGVTRVDNAMTLVGQQHDFLWGSAFSALDVTLKQIDKLNDNN